MVTYMSAVMTELRTELVTAWTSNFRNNTHAHTTYKAINLITQSIKYYSHSYMHVVIYIYL